MGLSKQQLDDICRFKDGPDTCSFLIMGGGGFECAKGTFAESTIRERRKAGTMRATGDNCSGPPDFETIEDAPVIDAALNATT